MTTDLPDPHGCPHCGSPRFDSCDGVVQCASCNAPRATATPGCPVRNAMLSRATDETFPVQDIDLPETLDWPTLMRQTIAEETQEQQLAKFRQEHSGFPSIAEETARERRVHGGGPRIITHDLGTGETWESR